MTELRVRGTVSERAGDHEVKAREREQSREHAREDSACGDKQERTTDRPDHAHHHPPNAL